MQYLWDAFDIKTFPAFTAVFVDGKFNPELSELGNVATVSDAGGKSLINIKKTGKLPVHIIYVGKIAGDNELDIEISAEKARVFITGKIICEKPVFLKKTIKNTGFLAEIKSNFLIKNSSNLKLSILAEHLAEKTGIFDKTKVVALKDSETELSGEAIIPAGSEGCESDIAFSALCAPDIKSIRFSPTQHIKSPPDNAEHSAAIWRGAPAQIEYLQTAGLSGAEVEAALREAFENE